MASIIENTLETLKALRPNLNHVYLRSDNASCYHCAYLLLSLPPVLNQEEGCIKTFQSFASLQSHLDVGKHMVRLVKESTYDEIRRKWAEHCQEEGCIKTFQSFASLQSHLDVGKHMVRLVKESTWVLAMFGVIQLLSTSVTKQRLAKS